MPTPTPTLEATATMPFAPTPTSIFEDIVATQLPLDFGILDVITTDVVDWTIQSWNIGIAGVWGLLSLLAIIIMSWMIVLRITKQMQRKE